MFNAEASQDCNWPYWIFTPLAARNSALQTARMAPGASLYSPASKAEATEAARSVILSSIQLATCTAPPVKGAPQCSCGTIFKITSGTNGKFIEMVVYRFQGPPDGAFVTTAWSRIPQG